MRSESKIRDLNGTDNLPPSQTQSTLTLVHLDSTNSTKEDYNPLDHRDVPHPTSTLGSFLHLLKSSLGTGMLAMPAAFKQIGLIPGSIGMFVVALVATHCIHILVSTSREICKECRVPSLSYTDTCEKVFSHGPKKLRRYSKHVRHFADYAMTGVCLGGTSVYVVFIAASIKDIIDNFYPEHNFPTEAYCGMLLLPLILITQIRYLKFLVPFSMFANICLLLAFGITFYYTFSDFPKTTDAELFVSVSSWPLFVTTAIFAMEGINVVMPVENEMTKPQNFLGYFGVLNATMMLVSLLYGIFGILGYLKYGSHVLPSITLHLPQDELLALSAKILVAIAVFFTYCLQMYAPMEIIWSRVRDKVPQKFHNITQIAVRTISVLLTVILSVAVPDLGLLISLVGAVFFSTLGLLIPIVVQTVHRWERDPGKYNYILWKNSILLVFYLVVLISGTFSAISEIVQKVNTI